MAYFDHLVENPEDALNEAAKRRGLSREAMSTQPALRLFEAQVVAMVTFP